MASNYIIKKSKRAYSTIKNAGIRALAALIDMFPIIIMLTSTRPNGFSQIDSKAVHQPTLIELMSFYLAILSKLIFSPSL